MNPIAFDFTLIVQMILFLLPALFIGVVIYFIMFIEWKRKTHQRIIIEVGNA